MMRDMNSVSGAALFSGAAVDSSARLTKRELDVLSLLARGASAKLISHLLGLSPRTVDSHAASIIRKFGARNRMHSVALAVHAGLVRPDLPLDVIFAP